MIFWSNIVGLTGARRAAWRAERGEGPSAPLRPRDSIMAAEPTQQQSQEEQLLARERSLQRTRPPTAVPGYELKRFLGAGAYGEVWVGCDRKTGRDVAVKFYTHRGGLDWSLLSREVEKLVFLAADRYVVQLLDVGWDAEPPYYVMEYVENGSLDDWLVRHGPLRIPEAVELFRDVATGLLHAHGRGVLHCDLKPANVLLDTDQRPRLADFGQSRLTHEQTPSLGTLFYMAPEQADMNAVPDARWDVYALGAMLYCTLTGAPPHRSDEALQAIESGNDLGERLRRYRQWIQRAEPPAAHRRVPGIDRALVELIDGCLLTEPQRRFSNVQAVLDALQARDRLRARRPLVMLGFFGPVLFVLVMALFGLRGYHQAKSESDTALTTRALEKDLFAAKAVATTAAEELQQYFRAVERLSEDPSLAAEIRRLQQPDGELARLLNQLRDPNQNSRPLEARDFLLRHPERQALQTRIEGLLADRLVPNASSWFVTDAYGTQLAAAFAEANVSNTVGHNYGWRTYFHGQPDDLIQRHQVGDREVLLYEPARADRHIREVHLSSPFQSKATNRWKVAVTAPVLSGSEFVGIVALTVDIGAFLRFDEGTRSFFAAFVDGRRGAREGMILEHPLFAEVLAAQGRLPDSFSEKRIRLTQFRDRGSVDYHDPLADEEVGGHYRRRWIAALAPVALEMRRAGERIQVDTGLKVIVQEDFEAAVAPVRQLGQRLFREGLIALAAVVGVTLAMWWVVLRAMREHTAQRRSIGRQSEATPAHAQTTVAPP